MNDTVIDKHYQLVPPESKILHTPTVPYDFEKEGKQLASEIAIKLYNTMKLYDGVGLSANQVGLPYRAFVMASQKGEPYYAVFNPQVISVSDEIQPFEEGCLSYPGVYVTVKRPVWVRVRFQTPYGEVVTRKFDRLQGRIALHELEHMDGRVFYRDASLYHRQRANALWKKLSRKQTTVDYFKQI